MTFGPRKTIEDLYGQELQVDVEMGDEVTVGLSITEWVNTSPPDPLSRRSVTTPSKLSPAQARELAEQLIEASKEAASYED